MKDQLTMIVALPQAGGCQSALPPERIEAKKPRGNNLVPLSQVIAEFRREHPEWFTDEEPGC